MTDTDIIIVGAGFGGIGLGARLRQQGRRDFVILERADGIGGVWRDNDYPGAACDIPAALYSYSFAQDYPWSTAYPPQAEILDYMGRVARVEGVINHVRPNRTVVSAAWDARAGLWTVTTAGGESWRAPVFVPAVGIFNDPVVPEIAGRETFAGHAFHSTAWRHGLDYAEARVAVVGTGASAVQIVPELVAAGAELTLFQRSAPYVVARTEVAAECRAAERARLLAEFDDVSSRRYDFAAAEASRKTFLDYLAEQVPEPELRAKLVPGFLPGCKRGLFSNDWYPALRAPNARIVTERIERVEPRGIRTADGELHRTDVIVWATGFNPTNYLPGMQVTGRNGLRLSDAWADGAEAHLGICVAGFPNMFLLYGPNTNVPGSILFMLECQAGYVLEALRELDGRSTPLEVRAQAMRRFVDDQQARISRSTSAPGLCTNYSTTQSGRVVTNYAGSQSDYRALTERLDPADFL